MVRVNLKKLRQKASEAYGHVNDTLSAADKFMEYMSDDIIPGLTPIGDTGLYITPSEPADPTDCDRYPDSPFCGGNPFTKQGIGFNPEIIINQCDIGITLRPVLGFIKMPPFSLVYRKPECRLIEPPHFPVPNYPGLNLPFVAPDAYVFVFLNWTFQKQYERYYQNSFYNELLIQDINFTSSLTWGNIQCPGISIDTHYTEVNGEIINYISGSLVSGNYSFSVNQSGTETIRNIGGVENATRDLTGGYSINRLDRYFADVRRLGMPVYKENYRTRVRQGEIFVDSIRFVDSDGRQFNPTADEFFNIDQAYYDTFLFPAFNIVYGKWSTITQQIFGLYQAFNRNAYDESPEEMHPYYSRAVRNSTLNISVAKILFDNCTEISVTPPPPPLEECCMACCPPQDDSLMKLLLKKINKLSEVVGVDDYPVSLPKSLISKHGEFTGNKQLNTLVNALDAVYFHDQIPDDALSDSKDIPSLTQLFGWYIERFDEIMGQFEIPIEVKDSDPTKSGDQPVGFRLPNIAESIAEMMMLLLNITMNSEALINMQTRTAIEVSQDKQQNFKNYLMTQAIADYLGFKHKEEKHKLPMMFHLGKENLDEFLKESETEVVGIEYDDKQNYQETLHRLLEAAAIIKAVHFRKVDLKGDVKQQIMEIIKGYSRTNKKINSSKDDFDTFIEDAEKGFTNTNGITDTEHPYGRNYDERPRIREIGNTSESD